MEELNLLIETFQKGTYDENEKVDSDSKIDDDGCNIFKENKKFDKLIVMGDVSSPADKSNDFANSLTVCWKFGYFFCISSISLIRQNQYGRWSYLRLKFLIFYPLLFN